MSFRDLTKYLLIVLFMNCSNSAICLENKLNSPCEKREQRTPINECVQETCCPTTPCKTDECCVEYTSCCRDCCDMPYRFWGSAQFLYWSTNYNFPFALPTTIDKNPISSSPRLNVTENNIQVNIVRTDHSWSPGVRVGIGFSPKCDCYDFAGYWTYYHNETHKTVTSDHSVIVAVFNEAKGSIHFNYNVADLEIGRKCSPCSKVFLRPFCGIRAAWLNQDYGVTFIGNESTFNVTIPRPVTVSIDASPAKLNLDHDIWSVGPRLGLQSKWGCFCGVSIIGDISASLLYGKIKQNIDLDFLTTEQVGSGPVNENKNFIKIHDSYWELFPSLQMLLGLSFNPFRCVRVNAGWEANFLWETSNILFFDRAISFQGLTLDVTLEF